MWISCKWAFILLIYNEILGMKVLAKVRHCANTGLLLGTESFREQVRRVLH